MAESGTGTTMFADPFTCEAGLYFYSGYACRPAVSGCIVWTWLTLALSQFFSGIDNQIIVMPSL